MSVKSIFISIVLLVSIITVGIIGYKAGLSPGQNGTVTVTTGKPTTHKIIQVVDHANKTEVNASIKAPIINHVVFSDLKNGTITVTTTSTDGFKQTVSQDIIKIKTETNYSTYLWIGGGALAAGIIATIYVSKKGKSIKIPMVQGRF